MLNCIMSYVSVTYALACGLNSRLTRHMFDELPKKDIFMFLIRIWEIDFPNMKIVRATIGIFDYLILWL